MSRYACRLAVLVLGYRAKPWLDRGVVDSILAATDATGGSVQVVYLDNYSRDGSVQWLLDRAPRLDVLLSPVNSMYCVGVNTLVQYAAYRYAPEYYLLVDADNMADADCYRRLGDFLDTHPRHGIAQPLVRGASDPSTIYSCGHIFTDDHWCMPNKVLPGDPAALLDLISCSISSTIVRSAVFEACGLLNPVYDIYYESADLSARARAAGFLLACVQEASAFNDGTEATDLDSMHHRYYFHRNRLIYWALNDAEVYAVVSAEARHRLAEFDRRLAASEFGLDATSESVRRGLADGLAIAAAEVRDPRRVPRLTGYDKTAAVLVQSGRPAGAPTLREGSR